MTTHELIERLKRRRVHEDTLGRETVYFVNPDGPEAAQALSTLTAEVEELRAALEAIKELADADEAFLCWKTANDALATPSSNTQEIEP